MAHILLAEDDDAMRQFLSKALENAGHDVTAKRDGLEAYEAVKHGEASYDLLLTDIVMPGMDGVELSRKAVKLHPDLKILYITGFAAVAMGQDKHKDANTHQMLSKPFHLNDLVEQVEKMLKTA